MADAPDHFAELERAMHRNRVRQCDPAAIRQDMRRAGVVLPLIEGAYRVGTRRVLDKADIATWYAVQTAPRMELAAADALREIGHACRVPMRGYLRQTRRKGKDGKFVMEAAYVPLCTGYAFLGLASGLPDWRRIRGGDGVVEVLSLDGRPEPIRGIAALDALFAADEAGAFDESRPAPDWTPEPGETVRVADGPFAGLIGRILRCKGDAARIVLDALFGGTEVDVDRGKLERVG